MKRKVSRGTLFRVGHVALSLKRAFSAGMIFALYRLQASPSGQTDSADSVRIGRQIMEHPTRRE